MYILYTSRRTLTHTHTYIYIYIYIYIYTVPEYLYYLNYFSTEEIIHEHSWNTVYEQICYFHCMFNQMKIFLIKQKNFGLKSKSNLIYYYDDWRALRAHH